MSERKLFPNVWLMQLEGWTSHLFEVMLDNNQIQEIFDLREERASQSYIKLGDHRNPGQRYSFWVPTCI